ATCSNCGYSSEFESWTFDRACVTTNWHFRLPLWLQVSCCGEILWAFNEDHLAFLEKFIGAQLRERAEDGWYSNHSMTIRLPKWMQSAKIELRFCAGYGSCAVSSRFPANTIRHSSALIVRDTP